ncbi:hypothetical protein B0H14DRAFT_3155912 [Mycena olivaceomarginata]|nr:hypothetical protein B0H14DRAFT_3155912 [Mycena olivaceomarginata]
MAAAHHQAPGNRSRRLDTDNVKDKIPIKENSAKIRFMHAQYAQPLNNRPNGLRSQNLSSLIAPLEQLSGAGPNFVDRVLCALNHSVQLFQTWTTGNWSIEKPKLLSLHYRTAHNLEPQPTFLWTPLRCKPQWHQRKRGRNQKLMLMNRARIFYKSFGPVFSAALRMPKISREGK